MDVSIHKVTSIWHKLKDFLVAPSAYPPNPEVLHRLGVIYSTYRLALSFFLIVLFLLSLNNPIIGAGAPYLYLNALGVYGFICLISYVILKHWNRPIENHATLMLVMDVCALTVMLYANGGPSLQMSMLYMVVVMAANMLLPAGRALAVALFAAITVIYQQFFYSLAQEANARSIGSAALLGLSFVALSFFAQLISRRLNTVEQLALNSSKQIRQLQHINQQIIEQNQTGLLVLDDQLCIVVMNKSAQQLVFSRQLPMGELVTWPLQQFNPALTHKIEQALQQQTLEFVLHNQNALQDVSVQLMPLQTRGEQAYTLITLQSLYKINQQVQQLKLASLGQLTASIAHEVRNPLAAISQASELMAESNLDDTDRELLGMIQKQTKRLDQTIENVLQMSRRQQAAPECIELGQMLPALINDSLPGLAAYIDMQLQQPLNVWFDPLQLQHVIINLLQNAVHHSKKLHDHPVVRVLGSREEQHVILDVMDSGPGISAEATKTLFEPFFTTEKNGTGLGLYLSKSFCDANGARLIYVPQTHGACFRIIFRLHGKSC